MGGMFKSDNSAVIGIVMGLAGGSLMGSSAFLGGLLVLGSVVFIIFAIIKDQQKYHESVPATNEKKPSR